MNDHGYHTSNTLYEWIVVFYLRYERLYKWRFFFKTPNASRARFYPKGPHLIFYYLLILETQRHGTIIHFTHDIVSSYFSQVVIYPIPVTCYILSLKSRMPTTELLFNS